MKPKFQMPFMYRQTWRASTYDGHAPDQDSIDLIRFSAGKNVSLGEPVFASADGTVVRHTTQKARAHPTEALSPSNTMMSGKLSTSIWMTHSR